MNAAVGLAWSREQLRRENERAAYRKPDSNPELAGMGVVQPSAVEERDAWEIESYMRSRSPRRLPKIRFIWVNNLRHIAGATQKGWSPGEQIVVLKAGQSRNETRRTIAHELDHVAAQTRALSDADRERRAELAADLCMQELGSR
jgi:hypothetical protein